ncbi:MAG: alpha/beta hydrolase [Acidobacteriota bacterium]
MPQSAFKTPEARRRVLDGYAQTLRSWPIPFESRQVETHLGPAHLLLCGDDAAPPLVLLHGGGGNATTWRPNVERLGRTARLYLLDLPGDAGRSSENRPDFGSDGHLRWLGEALDGLGLERPSICGASFGGWLALRFAAAHPDRVDRLAALAPPSLEGMRPSFALAALFAALVPTDGIARRFYRRISSPNAVPVPEDALADFVLRWRSTRPYDPPPRISDDELASLPAGTLVLFGADDRLFDVHRAAERVRRLAPAARVEIVPDAGHTLPVDQPEVVDGLLGEHFTA